MWVLSIQGALLIGVGLFAAGHVRFIDHARLGALARMWTLMIAGAIPLATEWLVRLWWKLGFPYSDTTALLITAGSSAAVGALAFGLCGVCLKR